MSRPSTANLAKTLVKLYTLDMKGNHHRQFPASESALHFRNVTLHFRNVTLRKGGDNFTVVLLRVE